MADVTLHCIYTELKVFTSPGGNVAEWNEQQARIQYNWLSLTKGGGAQYQALVLFYVGEGECRTNHSLETVDILCYCLRSEHGRRMRPIS